MYTYDILKYIRAGAQSPAVIWEFGHLLWRPLGLGLWSVFHGWMSGWYGGSTVTEITAGLFAVNFVAGLALTLLAYAISRRLGLGEWASLTVTTAILLCSAVLNYVHSGTAYIPGLALHLAGLWLLLKSIEARRHPALYAILAGVALALAFCFWFVYVLAIPAALAAGWFAASNGVSIPGREKARLLAITIATVAATGGLLILSGALICRISSASALVEWIVSSGHGMQQERRLIRFPSGLTRSFLYLSDEGLMLKRFVFGDPYAPVKWKDLLFTGVWKVATVFTGFAALAVGLARRREGRPALAVLACGVLATAGFAVLLFETSQAERYLPLYASLIVGVCGIIRLGAHARTSRAILGLILIVIAVVNLKAYAWDLRKLTNLAADRVRLIRQYAGGSADVVFVLSHRDPVSIHYQRAPLAAENRLSKLPIYDLIVPGNKVVLTWQADAACRVLQAWRAGGNAWLSERVLAARPAPDWGWSEYDDRHVRWVDVYGFFAPMDVDTKVGGQDGFRPLARTEKNQTLLEGRCGRPGK